VVKTIFIEIISFVKIQQQINFKLYLSLDKKDRWNAVEEKGKVAVPQV